MDQLKERAAERKHQHHVDCPSRLNSSRCGNYSTPIAVSNQSSSVVSSEKQKKIGDKMNQELVARREEDFSIIEQVVMQGDLSKLNPEQRVTYYRKVCESSGLNPFTNPFAYIFLNGKLTLYAKKDCTEQLRKIHGVSIDSLDDKLIDDIYIVTAKAKDNKGRIDQAKGAVVIGNLKGEAKANAIMKAETKAKRRVTLSICGMGWTDESEIDSIPNAKPIDVDFGTGEIKSVSYSPQAPLQIVENKPKLTTEQVSELEGIIEQCEEKYKTWVYDYLKKTFNSVGFTDVPSDMYVRIKSAAVKNMDEYQAKLKAEEQKETIATEYQ